MNAPSPATRAATTPAPALHATRRTEVFMDTPVTIEVVSAAGRDPAGDIRAAYSWFAAVESRCSRFDPSSELMQLCARSGEHVSLSPLLFAVLHFALDMAEETRGAFDPTLGGEMARRGFNVDYRSGETVASPFTGATRPGYRDVMLDIERHAVTLLSPLTLDLGAVAKGFAIDLAAHALGDYPGFVIDAGGDIFASGLSASGEPWSIGIRHPRVLGSLADTVGVSGLAVCTSGDYERFAPPTGDTHILDSSTGAPARSAASVTVIAPTAMTADAFATAVFVLGPQAGIALLETNGLEGMVITPSLESFETPGFARYRQ